MVDPGLLFGVVFAFCIAGFVKGMVGLGLPTVSLGLLSLFVDLPTAMALLVMPSLLTNIWQAIVGDKITLYFPLDALAILIFDQQDTDLRVNHPIVIVVIHFS